MAKDYIEITRSISANLKDLRKNQSDTMQGFSAMAAGALKDDVTAASAFMPKPW